MPPAVLRSAEAVGVLQCISHISAGDLDFLVETLEISVSFCSWQSAPCSLCRPRRAGGAQQTGGEVLKSEQHSGSLCISLDLTFITVQYPVKSCCTAELRGKCSLPRRVFPAPKRADLLLCSVGAGTELWLSEIPVCFWLPRRWRVKRRGR